MRHFSADPHFSLISEEWSFFSEAVKIIPIRIYRALNQKSFQLLLPLKQGSIRTQCLPNRSPIGIQRTSLNRRTTLSAWTSDSELSVHQSMFSIWYSKRRDSNEPHASPNLKAQTKSPEDSSDFPLLQLRKTSINKAQNTHYTGNMSALE